MHAYTPCSTNIYMKPCGKLVYCSRHHLPPITKFWMHPQSRYKQKIRRVPSVEGIKGSHPQMFMTCSPHHPISMLRRDGLSRFFEGPFGSTLKLGGIGGIPHDNPAPWVGTFYYLYGTAVTFVSRSNARIHTHMPFCACFPERR